MLSNTLQKFTTYFVCIAVAGLFALTGCTDNGVQPTSQSQEVEATENARPGNGNPAMANGNAAESQSSADQTIVEIAASNPDFSILVQAVQFAGLADELSGNRQFTVFAPTNAAFQDLLDQLGLTAGELLTEENKPLVTSILLYHVAPGKRFAKTVLKANRTNTLQKEFLMTKIMNGSPMIGNDTNGYATIVDTDIKASNGVIHVVDQVLLQPSY